MDTILDPTAFQDGTATPAGLDEASVRRTIELDRLLARLDAPRRDPLEAPTDHEHASDLVFVAGGRVDGRPVAVWRYALSWARDAIAMPARTRSSIGNLTDRHSLVAVETPAGTYHAPYPPEMGVAVDAETASELAAVDAALYAERERILDLYRRRRDEAPSRWRSSYDLALVAAAARLDLPPLPGPLDEAVEAARTAAERARRQARPRALLGWLHEREGRFAKAAVSFAEAARLAPERIDFVLAWGDNLVFAGRAEEAVAAFAEARRRMRARPKSALEPGRHRAIVADRIAEWIFDAAIRLRRSVEPLPAPVTDAELLAEARAEIVIDPERVPEAFRDLIPLVERWGIGDDALRGYATSEMSRAQKERLAKALEGRRAALNDWLDSFGEDLSDEAAHFMSFLLACEELSI